MWRNQIVIITNINSLFLISTEKGFKINTDIFETNIINLSIVIGLLVYYGRTALIEAIKNHKNTILKNIQEAENKFKEAEESLLAAKKNFEISKNKAEEIKKQGKIISHETLKNMLDGIDEDIKRFKKINLSTIKLEEEKSINEICLKLTNLSLSAAIEKINKKLNSSYQKKIISQTIEKLSSKIAYVPLT
jgi:F-type H+-transporting ATPase subunit b